MQMDDVDGLVNLKSMPNQVVRGNLPEDKTVRKLFRVWVETGWLRTMHCIQLHTHPLNFFALPFLIPTK
jgi:hypothetical protein